MKRALSLALLVACSHTPSETPSPSAFPGGKGDIWGSDDRAETYESATGTLARHLADASAALLSRTDLVEEEGEYRLMAESLGARHTLCDGERYVDQPASAFCSATLIAPDLVVTSGHCLAQQGARPAEARCEDVSVVFGFAYLDADDMGLEAVTRVAQRNVYSCARIEALG